METMTDDRMEKIQRLRERADIVDVIGGWVISLKKVGRYHAGECPFCASPDGEFVVNANRKFYHCFECGESGDVFQFVRRIKQVTFDDFADGSFTFDDAFDLINNMTAPEVVDGMVVK